MASLKAEMPWSAPMDPASFIRCISDCCRRELPLRFRLGNSETTKSGGLRAGPKRRAQTGHR